MYLKKFGGVLASLALTLVLGLGLAPQADAGAASSYLTGKFYGVSLQGTAFTAPVTVYVALGTGTFAAGTCTGEVTGGSYARVAVTSNTTNWVVATGVLSNGAVITFPAPTANWSVVNQICIYDAPTGTTNLLLSTALTTNKTVNSGDAAPSVAIGAFTWTIN